ncbi:hypothetical protein Fmac_026130 [Flemingia macrophylla]|uniref:Uncharacterized protein n=1 Tax=Flemingia macrophylla TaxID=520843 RepID=A0ABD1LE43_9FABA
MGLTEGVRTWWLRESEMAQHRYGTDFRGCGRGSGTDCRQWRILLRNLPTDIMVLKVTKQNHLEPFQSVLCGAPADSISASVTMSLDVVKTRLMTRMLFDFGVLRVRDHETCDSDVETRLVLNHLCKVNRPNLVCISEPYTTFDVILAPLTLCVGSYGLISSRRIRCTLELGYLLETLTLSWWSEKKGGLPLRPNESMKLMDLSNDLSMVHLPTKEISCRTLAKVQTDHHFPLLVEMKNAPFRRKPNFKFHDMWTLHPNSKRKAYGGVLCCGLGGM